MKISSLFKPLSFLPALALMYMIYSFSAQNGDSSSSISYKVSRKIIETVNTVTMQNWDEWEIAQHTEQIHTLVRKGAHITEYFLLAIAVSFPLYVYGVRGILLMLLAGAICVGYACTDEYHQSMVAGRAASFRDVMIDSIGIFFGVILTRLIGWSGRMAITGPAYERRQRKQQQELDEREIALRRREEALRREEYRLRNMSRSGQAARLRPLQSGAVHVMEPGHEVDDRTRVYRPQDGQRPINEGYRPQDRPQRMNEGYRPQDRPQRMNEGYRPQDGQRLVDEENRRQASERRKLLSRSLSEDSASDQLSEDLPFSRLFRKKKN